MPATNAGRKYRTRTMNMKQYIVCEESGAVDIEASVEAFRFALLAHVERNNLNNEVVEVAVNAVFDRFPGARLNSAFVQRNAINEIAKASGELSPEAESKYSKAILAYLEQPQFEAKRGKAGGIIRLAKPIETE